jgi:hypothetical protein
VDRTKGEYIGDPGFERFKGSRVQGFKGFERFERFRGIARRGMSLAKYLDRGKRNHLP